MKLRIKNSQHEKFKKYMANKLTEETGKRYYMSDIFIAKRVCGIPKDFEITENDRYRYIFANTAFNKYNSDTLRDVEYIDGDASFYGSQIKNLNNLSHIEGWMILQNSVVEDLGALKSV